jgi:hypothetical protein
MAGATYDVGLGIFWLSGEQLFTGLSADCNPNATKEIWRVKSQAVDEWAEMWRNWGLVNKGCGLRG